jgi:hypothetical protein
MWVKLGHEFLNLDQVVRVRFSKAFKANEEEWSAEVDSVVQGQLQVITRYRGAEALRLCEVLGGRMDDSQHGLPPTHLTSGVVSAKLP